MSEKQVRLRWIYLEDYHTKQAVGMRTWLSEWRVDIMLKDGKYAYWISECFNSGHDVYWTKSRFKDNIFEAMKDAENWLYEYVDRETTPEYDPDEDGFF